MTAELDIFDALQEAKPNALAALAAVEETVDGDETRRVRVPALRPHRPIPPSRPRG